MLCDRTHLLGMWRMLSVNSQKVSTLLCRLKSRRDADVATLSQCKLAEYGASVGESHIASTLGYVLQSVSAILFHLANSNEKDCLNALA